MGAVRGAEVGVPTHQLLRDVINLLVISLLSITTSSYHFIFPLVIRYPGIIHYLFVILILLFPLLFIITFPPGSSMGSYTNRRCSELREPLIGGEAPWKGAVWEQLGEQRWEFPPTSSSEMLLIY